jgi:hypothetical protein
MRKSRFSEEQIIGLLKEAEAGRQACTRLHISERTRRPRSAGHIRGGPDGAMRAAVFATT